MIQQEDCSSNGAVELGCCYWILGTIRQHHVLIGTSRPTWRNTFGYIVAGIPRPVSVSSYQGSRCKLCYNSSRELTEGLHSCTAAT